MIHKYCIEAVDRILNDLYEKSIPLDGRTVIFKTFVRLYPSYPKIRMQKSFKRWLKNSELYDLIETLT